MQLRILLATECASRKFKKAIVLHLIVSLQAKSPCAALVGSDFIALTTAQLLRRAQFDFLNLIALFCTYFDV
jgi:hypothetical protein